MARKKTTLVKPKAPTIRTTNAVTPEVVEKTFPQLQAAHYRFLDAHEPESCPGFWEVMWPQSQQIIRDGLPTVAVEA